MGRGTDPVIAVFSQCYSGILCLHFDNFWHNGTWRRVLFSLPKGAGHGHSLSQVQPLGLRIKSFNISDLRKTLSSRILNLRRKRTATFWSRKKGRGTNPVIAVFSQCFQSWRRRRETESTNRGTTSPDGKLLNHPTKELAA